MKTYIDDPMKKQTPNRLFRLFARKRFLLGAAALMFVVAGVRAQSVSTVISNNLYEPNSVATDGSGNAYITDSSNDRIVKFVPSTGTVSSFAGLESYPGSSDGPGTEAGFSSPMGIVYSAARGGLVVVDQGNQLIRFVAIGASYGTVSTLAGVAGKIGTNNGPGATATFNFPSGIAVDAAGNLYVADQGNNIIRVIDAANNVTNVVTTNGYKFLQPTGVAVDNNSNIWVTDTGNQVICMISNQSVYVVAGKTGVSGYSDFFSLFSLPTGILSVPTNNSLLIADTGNNVIRSITPTNLYGSPTYILQTVAGLPGVAGSLDGLLPVATFDSPVGLAADPFNFGYYVVDRDGDGGGGFGVFDTGSLRVYQSTTPLPPPAPPTFGYVVFTSPGPGLPPVTSFTAASEAVFNNTAIIAIEATPNTQTFITYGPTGSTIPAPGPNSGSSPQTYEGDNQTTAAPTIIPTAPDTTIEAVSEGPTGELSSNVTARFQFVTANPSISGINAAALQLTDNTLGAAMYYTLDGNIPTNGAADAFGPYYCGAYLSLAITTNVTLNVRAFTNNYAPSGVATLALTISNYVANTVNFSKLSTNAGTGATLAIPVFVTMAQSNTPLESIEFRAEIAPTGDNVNAVSTLTDLSFNISNFVVYPGVTGNVADYLFYTYANDLAQGVLIVSPTNSGLDIVGIGTVGLVEIPIPNTVTYGQTYSMTIINPSGTSDGNQASVALSGFTNTFTITDPVYLAGDSSPANGYNASEFGDGMLNNSDVNNAMYASVGIRTPYVFTDAYNDMDVYPPDDGDGFITLLDWQTILNRAVGLDTNNWIRFRTNGGILMHQQVVWTPGGPPIPLSAAEPRIAMSKSSSSQTPPGLVWLRQASVGAGTQINVAPGSSGSVPIYANVSSGSSLSGLQFRAILSADGSAPAPGAIKFSPAAGVPTPLVLPGLAANDIACFWAVGSFPASLKGSNYLGTITFQVPSTAQTGQSYVVHFSGVDGVPNMQTLYQLESFPGWVWVNSPALQPPQISSDEWRLAFFGSLTSPLAADNADADGDGMLNWQEYLAGTNPTNALSKLAFASTSLNANGVQGVAFTWLTAPGKTYSLESSPTLGGPNWTPINTNVGDGNNYQFVQPNYSGTTLYYRLQVSQ
jgi:sugar lactone lactonase YvrE